MKKLPGRCAIAGVFFLAVMILSAQDQGGASGASAGASAIDYAELENNLSPVSFINYEGPYARIDTRRQIWDIGYSLGLSVRQGTELAGSRSRYFIYHSVSGPESNRLNADIFGLGSDAGVDHIRNLRLIIQGYLEAAYQYSPQDAALIAEFSTIYNAVFRGNWDYFNTRYKTPLVTYLAPTPDRAGLSIRFDEWPGQTLMTLPLLTAAAGSLSAIDTGTITSPEVIDEMRKDDGRGVEARQGMVDLKEREAEAAQAAAQAQRERIAEEERRIAAERDRIAAEETRIQREREAATRAAADAAQSGEDGTTAEERAAAEDALRRQEEELAGARADLERREDALDPAREEAAANEAFAERKADEAQNDRVAIAQDQAEIIAGGGGGQQTAAAAGILTVRLTPSSLSPLGNPVRVEPATAAEIQRGALNTVSAPTLITNADRAFAVAGANTANGAIRLIEIDTRTLGMKAQGDKDIVAESPLWLNGGNLYALVSDNGAKLARFDMNLAQQAVSSTVVHPRATLSFAGNRLLIQTEGGALLSLDALTLQ